MHRLAIDSDDLNEKRNNFFYWQYYSFLKNKLLFYRKITLYEKNPGPVFYGSNLIIVPFSEL
jgi:hypothetical protein